MILLLTALMTMNPLKPIRDFARSALERTNLLEPVRDARFYASQLRMRAFSPLTKLRLDLSTPPDIARAVVDLRRDGIVILRGHIKGERLARLQSDFSAMIERIDRDPPSPQIPHPPPATATTYREREYDPVAKITYNFDPFREVPDFLGVALDPVVTGIVARYYGRDDFMMHSASATRYHPMEPRDFSAFQWHHDECGKHLNVITLLTDVGERDQPMMYLKGSHTLLHSRARWANSRFTGEEIDRLYPKYERMTCTTQAGSVMIFDSNGLHRGNRSNGASRDNLICNYNFGYMVYPFRVPADAAAHLTSEQRALLDRNPRVQYVLPS